MRFISICEDPEQKASLKVQKKDRKRPKKRCKTREIPKLLLPGLSPTMTVEEAKKPCRILLSDGKIRDPEVKIKGQTLSDKMKGEL